MSADAGAAVITAKTVSSPTKALSSDGAAATTTSKNVIAELATFSAGAEVAAAAADDDDDDVTKTRPPSHMLADGTRIHLPAPGMAERIRFFERSIARHGLLQEDLQPMPLDDDDEEQTEEGMETKNETEDATTAKQQKQEPKIHPLALASARLQASGINELNRAINLYTLVATGEYFGLSNIVDPTALESGSSQKTSSSSTPQQQQQQQQQQVGSSAVALSSSATGTAAAAAATEDGTDAPPTAPLPLDDDDDERRRAPATFVLKRVRSQYQQAARTLQRQARRWRAALVAQSRLDQRWRQLHPRWRLQAPEHATRALPHAVRPTEVVAADVQVYQYGDSASGGTTSNQGTSSRLARRVPRYATLELREGYRVQLHDLPAWRKKYGLLLTEKSDDQPKKKVKAEGHGEDAMEIDQLDEETNIHTSTMDTDDTKPPDTGCWTRAEPFAIPDPALGKVDADVDPTKVAMLTLQLDIEKPATDFCQSACLEPISPSSSSSNKNNTSDPSIDQDEQLLVALQHSLFCAKLFESIRRELAPDTEDVGQIRITTAMTQSAVWLSSGGESEENFVPPHSYMMKGGDKHNNTGSSGSSSGDTGGGGLAPLCVLHVHEGDVKVLLDCEYTLRIRLVEAGKERQATNTSNGGKNNRHKSHSGSQTPAQLRTLCQTLLLHAQEQHHRHSLELETQMRRQQRKNEYTATMSTTTVKPTQLKDTTVPSPRILLSCVSLGTKLLFERRIRRTLRSVNVWVKQQQMVQQQQQQQQQSSSCSNGETTAVQGLAVEWLSLSVFDLCAQFAVSFQSVWSIDVHLAADELVVTQFIRYNDGSNSDYRKVKFHTDREFELFLKMSLRRVLRSLCT